MLRALSTDELIEAASASELLKGMATDHPMIGVSGSILDGKFLTETREAAFAAGHQAMVPVIVGKLGRGNRRPRRQRRRRRAPAAASEALA